MKLCKVRSTSGEVSVGVQEGEHVHLFDTDGLGEGTLSEILHSAHPADLARSMMERSKARFRAAEVEFLPPLDQQEGERESEGAARFYDLVYRSARPELFMKATPRRVVGSGAPVRIRADARWSVPEPELALVVAPDLRIVGFTIGNDMSSRDIEGENPLYLPQAKIYNGSCSLGPVITLAEAFPPRDEVAIRLTINRAGKAVFEGATSLSAMARTFEDLVDWLGRENTFPDGVILLTGTGVVPPDDFTLSSGDDIAIEVTGIGKLCNVVA
jgi:2-dehydro-3-deoxy-D-arabinonate dehydratase